MADPFIGEIRMFAGAFDPAGWLPCDGRLLPISNFEPLFALVGTYYGGDGQSTFALPDLRGRLPLHQGAGPGLSSYSLGQPSGTEQVTLLPQNMPAHAHALAATGAATLSSPNGTRYGDTGANGTYVDTAPNATFAAAAHVSAGGSQPHSNLMPALCVRFIICVEGIFPQRN